MVLPDNNCPLKGDAGEYIMPIIEAELPVADISASETTFSMVLPEMVLMHASMLMPINCADDPVVLMYMFEMVLLAMVAAEDPMVWCMPNTVPLVVWVMLLAKLADPMTLPEISSAVGAEVVPDIPRNDVAEDPVMRMPEIWLLRMLRSTTPPDP